MKRALKLSQGYLIPHLKGSSMLLDIRALIGSMGQKPKLSLVSSEACEKALSKALDGFNVEQLVIASQLLRAEYDSLFNRKR